MNKVTLRVNFISLSRTKTFPSRISRHRWERRIYQLIQACTANQQKSIFHIENIQQPFHKTPPWFVFLESRSTWKFPKWGNNSKGYSKSTWSTLEFSAQLGNLARKNSGGDHHFTSERVVEGCTCRYIALIRKAREKTCLFLKLVILRSTQMINSSIGKCFFSMCSLLWCKVFLDLFRLMF